jgi:antirestriction protein ArdC
MNNKINEMVTDLIIKKLESGTIPWKKSWSTTENPKNYVSQKQYNGINYVLLGMCGYSSPNWMTFKQALDLGGNIKKGEKGMPVIYFQLSNVEVDGKNGTTELKQIPFMRYYTVFNIAQTNGIDDKNFKPEFDIDFKPIDSAEKIVSGYKNAPKIVFENQRACYNPKLDIINMPKKNTFRSENDYYEVLFHEMTHSTGHSSRLNRNGVTTNVNFGSKEYSKEELIAEFGSAFLCSKSKIDQTIDNSTAYIQSWLKVLKNDKNLIIPAASKAQKAFDYILELSY